MEDPQRHRHNELSWLKDPVTVIGTVVSVLIGVIFYVRTDVRTAVGVIAGLQATLLVLQIQLLLRQDRKELERTRASQLISSIEDVPWLSDPINSIATVASSVEKRYRSKTAALLAQEVLKTCVGDLNDLERGHYTRDSIDTAFLVRLTNGTQRLLRAVAVQPIGPEWPWWSSPHGRLYWAANVEAIGRGIRVERIFVYHSWNDIMIGMLEEQLGAGVHVYRVESKQLPPELRRNVIIWDEECGWEVTTNADGVSIGSYFTVNDYDLQKVVSRYNQIRASASIVSNPDTLTGAS